MSTPGVFPSFTRASGATPSRLGASTNRRKPIATCCAPRGSRSRRARARCRPRSARAGANPVRCSAPMPNTMRCRGTRSRSSPIRRRAPGFTLGPPGTPTRTRHDGTRRDPGSEGGNGEVRPRRHLALLRRARRKGLRLNAGARCQGLLRRRRRLHLLSPALHQHSDPRHAVRLLLERCFHVRDSRAGEVDRQEPHSDDPHLACGGPLPGCDRRALPDVYDDEIYQGGDVPAHRHLDPERVRLVGGDATSDNLPPRFSQIQYAWRSPSLGTSSRSTPCSNRTRGMSPR